MDRLDEIITNTAYVLDCLMSLRNIQNSGSCNECIFKVCPYKPNPGALVRYNCPHYVRKEEKKKILDNNK